MQVQHTKAVKIHAMDTSTLSIVSHIYSAVRRSQFAAGQVHGDAPRSCGCCIFVRPFEQARASESLKEPQRASEIKITFGLSAK